MEFELESILIIISCGLNGIEKIEDGLQVIHTFLDVSLYELALLNFLSTRRSSLQIIVNL